MLGGCFGMTLFSCTVNVGPTLGGNDAPSKFIILYLNSFMSLKRVLTTHAVIQSTPLKIC